MFGRGSQEREILERYANYSRHRGTTPVAAMHKYLQVPALSTPPLSPDLSPLTCA